MALFQKRHYVWLARFARAKLNYAQISALADELARDSVKFNRDKFLDAAKWQDKLLSSDPA